MESKKWMFYVGLTLMIILIGSHDLLKPVKNECSLASPSPDYIPISVSENNSYGLYLYRQRRNIDFNLLTESLHGVPLLFIPGSAGSYKQMRWLAEGSYSAYTSGSLEQSFYDEASSAEGFSLQYASMLDWFAVDLQDEHSAFDTHILEDHAAYVVHAIHRILDQYKKATAVTKLPTSVILIGHSMGGFVARAAAVHPDLRKSSVQTIITFASPHQSPPAPVQPSMGYYYASINQRWREEYKKQAPTSQNYKSYSMLSDVVVISISAGINDYQVRSKLQTLDGIVPPTHGFMVSSTEMKNVWLSMGHVEILECNELVIQVSHTLLSLVDPETGQPFIDKRRRLTVFSKMLRSTSPWRTVVDGSQSSGSYAHTLLACPEKIHWNLSSLERDLYIQTTSVTILAMDGRRRWLDIKKLGSNGTSHFVLVTNRSPCYGIRIHLWLENGNTSSELPLSKRAVDVTTKMSQIRLPKQIESGRQPPPSALFWLSPDMMKGFRFITISVAPRQTVSGQSTPAASMAVGQFFSLEESVMNISPSSILLSTYSQKEISVKEEHPIALSLSFAINLGLLPVTLSLKTTDCGIKGSMLQGQEDGDVENSRLCKLRCFPAVALAWDQLSGLHVYPNLNSETIIVDSAPAHFSVSEKTAVLLVVDPHCAYTTSFSVSITAAASRLLLLYCSKIAGLAVAVVLFAMMRQAQAWERNLPLPSVLTAVEYNMRLPFRFIRMTVVPLMIMLLLTVLWFHQIPSVSSYFFVSLTCYAIANGFVIVLILASRFLLYIATVTHVFLEKRWQKCDGNSRLRFFQWFISLPSRISASKVTRLVKSNSVLVTAVVAIVLVCFVHPALGLSILVISHVLSCHSALFSLTYENQSVNAESANSYGEIQLEIFHHRHGMMILHLLAWLMFLPSLLAWCQRLGSGQSFPWLLDSMLCTGIILHISDSKPENNFIYPFGGLEIRLSFIYLLAGFVSFLSGLALAPYQVFYAIATIGALSFLFRVIQRRNREKGETIFVTRKRSHQH